MNGLKNGKEAGCMARPLRSEERKGPESQDIQYL